MKGGVIINGNWNGFQYDLWSSREFPESEKTHIGYDCIKASPLALAIGQQCYAISFSLSGRVFTIYRIVKDYIRSKSTGFLSISLFLPFGKNLSGEKIKELLDESMSQSLEFLPDNNLGAVNVNWSFIEGILSKYNIISDDNPRNHVGIWNSGLDAAAYIYCNDELLIKYFNDPYQTLFKEFRQVLFIDEKNQEINILQAFKHSRDLTRMVEILNPDYVLNIKGTNEIKIRRLDNDKFLQNGDEVKMNTQVSIEISKLYCEPSISKQGAFEDLKNELGYIVDIIPNLRTITINLPKFSLREKTIKLNFTDDEGLTLDPPFEKISFISSARKVKTIGQNSDITFYGEETEQEWYCEIKKSEQYKYSKGDRFTPARDNIIYIKLDKNKERKVKGNGGSETGEEGISNAIFYGLIITALAMIGLFSYLLFWRQDDGGKVIDPEGNGEVSIKIPLDKAYGKKIIDYSNGMELFRDSLIAYKDTLSTFQPDSTVNSALNKAIKVRDAIEKGDSSAIGNMLQAVEPSDRQKPLFAVLKDKNINYLKEIPDRKNISLKVIKHKLDSIISSKITNTIFDDNDFEDANNGKDITNEGVGKNNLYKNVEFQKKITGFKNPQDFNQLDEQKLTDEQKQLLNIIKLHIPEIYDGKFNWFKTTTTWPKFKEKVLELN